MLFYNYHSPSEGPIRPTVPQSIEIGGIQVKEQADPLPKELAKFLDKADEGAIFFSLGTNVNTNTFRPDTVDILYKVLSKLPQRVIWKWEDLKNKPKCLQHILRQLAAPGRYLGPSEYETIHNPCGQGRCGRGSISWSSHGRATDLWRSTGKC